MAVDTDGGWPDARGIPWPMLIRIRYLHELDVLILAVVQRAVADRLPEGDDREFARRVTGLAAAVTNAARDNRQRFPSDRLGDIASRLADADDLLRWPNPPHPNSQGPDPSPWRGAGVAEVALALDAATRLVEEIGSAELRGMTVPLLRATLTALAHTAE